jgi:uncharacterized OB-fold protein
MTALVVGECRSCGARRFPKPLWCDVCGSDVVDEVRVSSGTVSEATIRRHVAGRSIVPLRLGTIRLTGGGVVIGRLGQRDSTRHRSREAPSNSVYQDRPKRADGNLPCDGVPRKRPRSPRETGPGASCGLNGGSATSPERVPRAPRGIDKKVSTNDLTGAREVACRSSTTRLPESRAKRSERSSDVIIKHPTGVEIDVNI